MLILRTSLPSPFGRKVRIAADVAGLTDRIRIEPADTNDPGDSLRAQNPLGKIPTLLLDDGEPLFDSRVIVEYLNDIAAQPVLVPPGAQRIPALRQQALADGLMDAAILQVYEGRFRPPELRGDKWLTHQRGKMDRALAYTADHCAAPRTGVPHIGEIAQACALGYLDLRFDGAWRAAYPALVAWLDDFARRTPAFARTAPQA
jgi:glutathione S-transferase